MEDGEDACRVQVNNKESCAHLEKVEIQGFLLKAYRIVGNFRWVQIFAILVDRPASAKIKTAKK